MLLCTSQIAHPPAPVLSVRCGVRNHSAGCAAPLLGVQVHEIDTSRWYPSGEGEPPRENTNMSHDHKSNFDSHFNPQSSGVQYGLLRGQVVKFGAEDGTSTPHFQIIVQDDVPQIWRVAVNVR